MEAEILYRTARKAVAKFRLPRQADRDDAYQAAVEKLLRIGMLEDPAEGYTAAQQVVYAQCAAITAVGDEIELGRAGSPRKWARVPLGDEELAPLPSKSLCPEAILDAKRLQSALAAAFDVTLAALGASNAAELKARLLGADGAGLRFRPRKVGRCFAKNCRKMGADIGDDRVVAGISNKPNYPTSRRKAVA